MKIEKCAFLGGIWNATAFLNSLGVTAPTVRSYLDYMESAFLIRKLQPWFVNAEKRLVKSPKIYFRDSGLLHALLYIDEMDELYGHHAAGNSWESFVIEQIFALIDDRVNIFYFRTHHGAEADLVFVKGIKPISSIEIKHSNSPIVTKGFHESINTLKTKRNFVITPNSDTYETTNKITVCALKTFLENYIQKLE